MAQQGIRVHVYGDYNDKDIKRAMRDLQSLQFNSLSTAGKMQQVGAKLQGIGQSVSNVGKQLTLGVTLPIVGAGAAATAMAVEFESSMAKIVGLVGIAADEVDGMRKDVIALSGETAKSPKELADALFVVTSAGLRGADAMSALEFSAKAGAAGLGETTDIARSLAGAMNAYGPEVVDAARATDMIVATARAGNFETSQFAAAIGRVLPFAKQAGSSLEDMGGAVALLTRTNGDAAQSVTQVAALFRAFVVPTEEAKKSLEAVGLSAADVRKSISEDGLPAALDMLDKKLGGNREQLGKLLGSSEAAAAAFQILDADAATLAGTFGAVNEATGITEEAFGVVADTSGFKLQQAFTTLKASLIEFGDIIVPVVAAIAEKITALATKFSELSTPAKTLIVVGLAIAAAIGPILLIVGKLIIVVGVAIKFIGMITAAMALLALKIAAIVAIAAGVVAAFVLIYNNSEALRTAISNLITTVQNVARAIFGDLTRAFGSASGAGSGLGNILRTVANVLGVILARAVDQISGALSFMGNIVRVAIKAFEVGFTVLTMVANIIRGIVLVAFDALMNKLGPVSTAFKAMANGIRNAISTVGSFVSGVFNNIGKAVETFINFGIKAVNALITAYNKLADFLPGVSRASLIAEFRFQNLSAATNSAASSANNAANQIGGYASQVLRGNKAVEAGVTVTNAATVATNDFAAAVGGSGGGGAGGRGGGAAGAAAKAAEDQKKFNDRVAELKTNLENAIKAAKDYVVTVADKFVGQLDLGAALDKAKESGRSIVDEFLEQGKRIARFGETTQKLLAAGLSKPAFDAIIAAGVERGADIADALAQGNIQENVANVNSVYASVQAMGTQVGQQASGTFMAQGIKLATDMLIGFIKEFMPAGKKRRELLAAINGMVTEGLASLGRLTGAAVTAPISVGGAPDVPGAAVVAPAAWEGAAATAQVAANFSQSVLDNARRLNEAAAAGQDVTKLGFTKTDWAALAELERANVRAFADGGLVLGPTLGLVGEAGPELIIPLDRLGRMNGGNTINVTVNAGIGTDGAEVGRQVVDAIRAYERRNGAVYVAA